jgi:hypothetical protein
MTWIFALLGLAAMIAGGSAVTIGWPRVPLESGWTLVISGSALISGGLVCLAIAGLIFETRRTRLAVMQALARPGTEKPTEKLADKLPEQPAVEIVSSLPGTTVAEPAQAGIEAKIEARLETKANPVSPPQPRIEPAAPAFSAPSASQRMEASAPSNVTSPSRARIEFPAAASTNSPAPARFEPPAPTSIAPPRPLRFEPKIPTAAPSAISALSAAPHIEPTAPAPTPAQSDHASTESTEGETAAENDVEASPRIEGLSEDEEAPPMGEARTPDELQPARSFSVGETTFIVFTDGSIEARTPRGSQRFESMEEVRAYLQQAVP